MRGKKGGSESQMLKRSKVPQAFEVGLASQKKI